jgi:hypothetical protein
MVLQGAHCTTLKPELQIGLPVKNVLRADLHERRPFLLAPPLRERLDREARDPRHFLRRQQRIRSSRPRRRGRDPTRYFAAVRSWARHAHSGIASFTWSATAATQSGFEHSVRNASIQAHATAAASPSSSTNGIAQGVRSVQPQTRHCPDFSSSVSSRCVTTPSFLPYGAARARASGALGSSDCTNRERAADDLWFGNHLFAEPDLLAEPASSFQRLPDSAEARFSEPRSCGFPSVIEDLCRGHRWDRCPTIAALELQCGECGKP